jgi:hypothetical protein
MGCRELELGSLDFNTPRVLHVSKDECMNARDLLHETI